MRLGILTGGGDAPGLNAAIRAVVKSAANHGCETIGIEDSFAGLVEPNRWRRLTPSDVTGILRQGGTILGTTNKKNPLAYPSTTGGGTDDQVILWDMILKREFVEQRTLCDLPRSHHASTSRS